MAVKLLAIDTAESACSAALLLEGVVLSRMEQAARSHSERILPMMQSLLSEAGCSLNELDALAFGRGPGSFTGLRIAAGVIQGAALGAGLPVVPVSTLRAMAQGAFRKNGARQVLSALDARMAEVYWGVYVLGDNDLMQPSIDELVCAPKAVPAAGNGDWFGVGSGWQAYPQTLEERAGANLVRVLPDMQIDARDMLHLAAADFMAGRAVGPEHAIPVYLRDNVARKKAVQ